jgi:hypothetical protein
VIELTDEMIEAFYLAGQDGPDVRAGLAAVLAIVERDRCMEPKGHVWHPLTKPGPCPALLKPFASPYDLGGLPCKLRAGHEGMHENGVTSWGLVRW